MGQLLFELRERAAEEYRQIGRIYCPYFQEEVHFTSEGFNHIRYRKARNERHIQVQEMRYKLLHFAPELVRLTKTLQEHEIQHLFVETKHNKRKEIVLKEIQFFGFIAILKNYKVKVIVRQVGNGQKHFWSIIPNWKTRRTKDGRRIIQQHTGDLLQN